MFLKNLTLDFSKCYIFILPLLIKNYQNKSLSIINFI